MNKQEMKEFCKDMPERTDYKRSDDPNWIKLKNGIEVYIFSDKPTTMKLRLCLERLQHYIPKLIFEFSALELPDQLKAYERDFITSLNEWYNLQPNKNTFIKQLDVFVRQSLGKHTPKQKNTFDILNSFIDGHAEIQPQAQTKHPKPKKDFIQYIEHKQAKALAEAIKTAFTNDSIITLSVLIHTLRHEFGNKPLLIIASGEMLDFHTAMAEYFEGKDIGARTNYKNDLNYYRNGHNTDIVNCKARINTILQLIDK